MARPGLLIAALLTVLPAEAQALTFSWDAPAKSCPGESAVRAQLIERVEASRAEALVVSAKVTKTGAAFVMQATIAGVERKLEGNDCRSLARALAVSAALLAEPEKQPEPVEPPPRAPEPAPMIEVRTDPPRATPTPYGFGVQAKAGVAAFVLPSPTFAIAPGVFAEIGRARIEAAATWMLGQSASIPGFSGGEGSADFAGATLTACYAHPFGALELDACGGGTLGALRVATVGITEPGATTTTFGWLSASAAFRWYVGAGFSLFADVAANVHLSRPAFAVDTGDGAARFYQPAPVALLVHLGTDFRWRSQNR